MNDTYLITWKPIQTRPQEASYVLVRRVNKSGRLCCEPCAYEDGQFRFTYGQDDWLPMDEDSLRGWTYYPYDEHT